MTESNGPVTPNRPAACFWHDSVPGGLQPGAALESDITADIVIVGAGYTGLWTAYYLKKHDPSLQIAILEAETAGFGASGRNGGWCSAFLSGISHWLDRPATRDEGIRLQRQMFETVPEIGRVTRDEGIDCHFEQAGALEIAVIPQQRERIDEEIAYVRALGFGEDDYRLVEGEELRETIHVDKAIGAVHMAHCASVHPARLARGLADTVRRLGVSIYDGSPVLRAGAGWVETAHATARAETVLFATEGYSRTIRGLNNRLIPLHSMMVVTEPLTTRQLEEVAFRHRYCFGNMDRMVTYGHLTADNRIAFGCRGTYFYNSAIREFGSDDPDFNRVRSTFLRFFPGLRGVTFTHAWGGCMGVSRTLRPSVHFDRRTRQGWAGGYFGNGVGATHLAARTLADLVLDRDTDRVNTPWVNPPDSPRRWEPEPLRWLGIRTRAWLMQKSDNAEYRGSALAPAIVKTLETVFPK